MYPTIRMRRNRKAPWIRDLIAENSLDSHDMILPIFVTEGENTKEPIPLMPGIYCYSTDLVVDIIKHASRLGIKAISLFPRVPTGIKSQDAEEAYNLDNLICRTIRMIKSEKLPIGIICDVALDPYTSHGHDGIVDEGKVNNEQTIEALCNQSLILAKAGADCVAPSDMMDGRVKAIRDYLDSEGFTDINIISYAAKYASNYYGPFRNAINSEKQLGNADKKTYQMDYRNSKEAIQEIALDIEEGADAIIIKPGMPYLDIMREASTHFDVPIFGYQVSGEYSMLRVASEKGCLDFGDSMIEALISFKRAGCSAIFCYAALEIAEMIKNNR